MAETVVRERGIQFSSNVFVNVAVFALNFVVGLLLVPFFINQLGVAAYGLIPLATTATSYVVVIADSMGAAMSRFMTGAMNKNDTEDANKTYSTATIGILMIVLILIPIMILLAWISPEIFDIATSSAHDVRFLFMAIFISMLINVAGYGFTSVLFAKNRIDYQASVKFVQIGLQTTLIVALFYIFPPSLVSIGIAYLLASVVALALVFILSKKVFPEGKVRRQNFNRCTFRSMMSLSAWETMDQIGSMLFAQASLIIANPLLGATEAGKFAIVIMMTGAIYALSSAIYVAIRPLVYLKYEEGKSDEMVKICVSGAKIGGTVMAMPMAFICVFSAQILMLWVGPGFEELSIILWLMFFVLMGNIAMYFVFPISTAYFKVKNRGIATVLCGILNIVLAVVFILYFDMGIVGVGLAWAISLAVKNWIFTPWYHAKITGKPLWVFYKPYVFFSSAFLLTAAIGLMLNTYFTVPTSFIVILTMISLWFLVHIVIVFRILISKSEKELVFMCIPERFRKFFSKIML